MAGIEVENVASIVQSIFATMMDLSVEMAERYSPPQGDRLTASVFLEGSWNGAVSIECSRQQACDLAGRFLCGDAPSEVDDDVRDVMGELANIIGGNFKSTLGADVRLSVPSVIDGSDYEVRVCGTGKCEQLGFRYAGGDFSVLVRANDVRTHRSQAASPNNLN